MLFGVRTLIKLSILSVLFLGLNVSRDHSTLAVSRKLDSGQVGTTTKSTTQSLNAWQEIVRERWGKDVEVSLVNQSNDGISCLFLKGDRNCSRYWIKISVIVVSFEVYSLIPDLLLLSEISCVHYFPKSFNLLGQYFRAEKLSIWGFYLTIWLTLYMFLWCFLVWTTAQKIEF